MDEAADDTSPPRPYRAARRLNLQVLIEEAGGAAQLGRICDVPKSHLSALTSDTNSKPRNVGDDLATKLEMSMGKAHGWMDNFHPELYSQEIITLPPKLGDLAHALSQPSLQTLLLTWSEVMSLSKAGGLPDLFRVKMPDASMAPRVPEGRALLFSTKEAARAGDGVLVADRDGNLFIRTYKERRPGVWVAKPENPDFEELDSERDGLSVVAVLMEMGRWAQ